MGPCVLRPTACLKSWLDRPMVRTRGGYSCQLNWHLVKAHDETAGTVHDNPRAVIMVKANATRWGRRPGVAS